MNSFELNKIVGAILLGGFVLLVSSILAKTLVQPQPAETVAMAVPQGEAGGGTAAAPAEETLEPVIPLLANADLAAGEAAFKKCTSCHTIEKGGANKIGPNLWGSVGAPHAHVEGFNYSEALTSKPGSWDYESLNAWLHSPKTYAPGTKMTFAGIKKVEERANLIAWLRTQADSPLPLPDAAAVAAAQTPPEQSAAEAAPTQEPQPGAEGTAPDAPSGGEQTAALPGGGLANLLQSADPAAGEKAAAKCKACHSFDKGGPNKVGPNLWDIVGAEQAHLDDFNYSDAIAGLGGTWTYAELDEYLTAPREYAPGTKMVFPGIKKPEERAAVIAYLRTLSDAPKPLPAAAGEAAPQEAVPTGAADVEAQTPVDTETATAPSTEAPPAATAEPTEQQTAATPPSGGLADLLKSADPAAGEKVAAKCKACHSFDKGAPNKVGPNLWDIVGAKQAHLENFNYSDAIAGLGGTWTYEELDKYLTAPRAYAPGTKMVFAGIKKPEERAAVIAYLRSLSDSPQPLP